MGFFLWYCNTSLYIALSASIPLVLPSFTFKVLIPIFSRIKGKRSLASSGLMMPNVIEVACFGFEKPKSWYKGIPAFFAFKSHKAISKAARAQGDTFCAKAVSYVVCISSILF